MRFRVIAVAMAVLLAPVAGVSSGQVSTRVRKSELESLPFIVTPLKIVITKFKASRIFDDTSAGQIEMTVENTSTGFSTFYPQRFSLVGSDNEQVDLLYVENLNERFPTADRRIAPSAHIEESYRLTDKVRLPARLYYDDKLLAVITD